MKTRSACENLHPLFRTALLCFATCARAESKARLLYGQNNALWSQASYFRGYSIDRHEKVSEQETHLFGKLLRENKIKYAYMFSGPFFRNGNLPKFALSATAKAAIQILHQESPETVLVPWIGGLEGKQVYLENPQWVDASIDSTLAFLNNFPADHVHINFEYLLFGKTPDPKLNYSANFKRYFEKLHSRAPQLNISTAIPATAPATRPWKYKHSVAEIFDFAPFVNQIAFLFYDTHIHDPKIYTESLNDQVNDFARIKEKFSKIQLLMGTGTFVNDDEEVRAYRDLAVENIPNHLQVLKGILDKKDKGNLVDGLAIFCDWKSDPEKWGQIKKYWTGL